MLGYPRVEPRLITDFRPGCVVAFAWHSASTLIQRGYHTILVHYVAAEKPDDYAIAGGTLEEA